MGSKLTDLFRGHEEGMNFTVDFELPHPPGNKLSVLGAKVQYENFFLVRIAHYSPGNNKDEASRNLNFIIAGKQ